MTSIHKSYVESLLNNGAPVMMGGQLYHFHSGGGWFGDKMKSIWGKTKEIFNNHVKPAVVNAFNKVKEPLLNQVKEIGSDAYSKFKDADGSLKDQLRAGLSSIVKDSKKLPSQIVDFHKKANKKVQELETLKREDPTPSATATTTVEL